MASLPPKPPRPALPPGWTEHVAPTGHPYYHHAATGTSTYTRPMPLPPPPVPTPGQLPVAPAHTRSSSAPSLAAPPQQRHALPPRPAPPPADRPKKKRFIPGAEPWVLVITKQGRKFFHNPESEVSVWDAPEEIVEKVKALPEEETEEEKAARRERRGARRSARRAAAATAASSVPAPAPDEQEEQGEQGEQGEQEEYEEQGGQREQEDYDEVEEGSEEDEDEEPEQKKAKVQESAEYGEDDIAWQLQAMAEEYGLDESDLVGESVLDDSEAVALFGEMLTERGVNPYGMWDAELPKIVDDDRYTALPNTKRRKDTFTKWCRDRIAELKKEKEKEKLVDPRSVFWGFLKEKTGSGRLYWMEFKRKWRKEQLMKDSRVSDKEREKMYRDYIARLKTPADVREADLRKLLKTTKGLSRRVPLDDLPTAVLVDVRYVTAPDDTRDSIIKRYLDSLPDEPDAGEKDKERAERERREAALREREREVTAQRKMNEVEERRARIMLREQEAEVERAKTVGKRGLMAQLRKGEEGTEKGDGE